MKQMAEKTVVSFLASVSVALCLTAPYLHSVVPLSDSTVQLSWRNNDIASVGYIVSRTTQPGQSPSVIGSTTALTYVDKGLTASTAYYYIVRAYQATDTSAASNVDSTTTLAGTEIFNAPRISTSWDIKSKQCVVKIKDNSTVEKGHTLIFTEFKQPGTIMAVSLPDSIPKLMDTITKTTANLKLNTWYVASAISFRGQDTLWAPDPDTIFTLNLQGIIDQYPKLYPIRKLSEFPIIFGDWALKTGDTILIAEGGTAPKDSSFSLISVADPSHPAFLGYRKTLLPFTLPHSGPGFSKGSDLFFISHTVTADTLIRDGCYEDLFAVRIRYSDGIFIKLDSILIERISGQGVCDEMRNGYRIRHKSIKNIEFISNRIIIQYSYERMDNNGIMEISACGLPIINDSLNGQAKSIFVAEDEGIYSKWTSYIYLSGLKSYNNILISRYLYETQNFWSQKNFPSSFKVQDLNQALNFSIPTDQVQIVHKNNSEWFVEDSLAQALFSYQHLDRYLFYSKSLPTIRESFYDSTRHLAFLVYDSVLSVWQCDSMPATAIPPSRDIVIHKGLPKIRLIKAASHWILEGIDIPLGSEVKMYSLAGKLLLHRRTEQSGTLHYDLKNITSGVYILNIMYPKELKQSSTRLLLW